jgi:hypothetical protein
MSVNFPTVRAPAGTNLKCGICLTYDFEETNRPFLATPCPHYFHRDCMVSWEKVRTNYGCPECNQRIFQAAQAVLQVNDDQAEGRELSDWEMRQIAYSCTCGIRAVLGGGICLGVMGIAGWVISLMVRQSS